MKRLATLGVLSFAVALGLFWAERKLDVGDDGGTPSGPARSEQRMGASQTSKQQERRRQTEGEHGGGEVQPKTQLGQLQRLDAERVPTARPAATQAYPSLQAEVQSPDTHRPYSVDLSYVGQPFPVSESIRAICDSWLSCKSNKKLLADMAREPREEPWATEAERTIRTLVSIDPATKTPRETTFTIRALECRQSICFLEAASIMEGFHTELYDFEKTSGLKAGDSIHGSEIDADGTKVYVSLWPFVRD
jgi:hypothetical protein